MSLSYVLVIGVNLTILASGMMHQSPRPWTVFHHAYSLQLVQIETDWNGMKRIETYWNGLKRIEIEWKECWCPIDMINYINQCDYLH